MSPHGRPISIGPARLWKVPLVSSMVVVAAFGLAMTHYF